MTGLELEVLTRRLAATPAEFLEPPRVQDRGSLHVAALCNDVALRLGARLPPSSLPRFLADGPQDANRLAVAAILCWLLADDWFVAAAPARASMPQLIELLDTTAGELARSARAQQFVADPEGREELARVALARLGFLPAGETPEQAADRLTAISGMERRRLLEASRAAEQRARQIREALARKAAEEAADKWSRE